MTWLPRLTRALSVAALGGVLRAGAQAAVLIRAHDCRSGAAPRGNPVPGHSVVDVGDGHVCAPADLGVR